MQVPVALRALIDAHYAGYRECAAHRAYARNTGIDDGFCREGGGPLGPANLQ